MVSVSLLARVDRRRVAGVERVLLAGLVVAVAEQQARVARDGGLGVLGELVRGDEELAAVPEHVGVGVRAPVGEDPGVLPRLGRRVEPEDVEVLADDVPHVGPPHPVVEPQDALGALGAGGRATTGVGGARGLDTGGRGAGPCWPAPPTHRCRRSHSAGTPRRARRRRRRAGSVGGNSCRPLGIVERRRGATPQRDARAAVGPVPSVRQHPPPRSSCASQHSPTPTYVVLSSMPPVSRGAPAPSGSSRTPPAPGRLLQ